jgi:hypothetical protein
MLFKKLIAVYTEDHMKHIITSVVKLQGYWLLMQVVRVVATGLLRVN